MLGDVEPRRGPVLQLHDPGADRRRRRSWRPIDQSLLGLVSRLAPAIVGGNTAVVIASERSPLPAVSLAEVLATSDVPGGVVNILTGAPPSWCRGSRATWTSTRSTSRACRTTCVADTERAAADNVKRVHRGPDVDPFDRDAQSPYEITALMEFKTVWHPMGA